MPTVTLPIRYKDEESIRFIGSSTDNGFTSIIFPNYCVYCCANADKYEDIKIKEKVDKRVARKLYQTITYEAKLKIPYCEQHHIIIKRINSFHDNIFAVTVFLSILIGTIGYIMSLIRGEFVDNSWITKFVLFPILFLIIEILIGAIIGILLSSILHIILAIFLKRFRQTPIPTLPGKRSLGVKIKYITGGKLIRFHFKNSSYAAKFAEQYTTAKFM